MKRLLLTLLFALPLLAVAQQSPAPADVPTFAYLLRLPERLYSDDAWTQQDIQTAGQHWKYIQGLSAKGIVVFVGRTDPPSVNKRVAVTPVGMVVFRAKDMAEAEGIMKADPAIASGVMLGEVQPFRVLIDPK